MGYLLETGRGKALEYQGTRVFCGAVPKIAPTSPGAERRGQGGNYRGRRLSSDSPRSLELADRLVASRSGACSLERSASLKFHAVLYIHRCLVVRGTTDRILHDVTSSCVKLYAQARAVFGLSSTHKHASSDGLPPNLTCSDMLASARLRFTKGAHPGTRGADSTTARSRSQYRSACCSRVASGPTLTLAGGRQPFVGQVLSAKSFPKRHDRTVKNEGTSRPPAG
jgi:hypothetical protein